MQVKVDELAETIGKSRGFPGVRRAAGGTGKISDSNSLQGISEGISGRELMEYGLKHLLLKAWEMNGSSAKLSGGWHMKLLSFAVPCYNSEAYMEKCIESLLVGGEEVEILIIDDGSKDRTAEIADGYAEKYPTIVKAIHKENGGHGSAVNTGIANATGLYFKVVDSDDWVKEEVYRQILAKLHELTGGETTLDMLISNFVYEKAGEKHKKVMRYRHALPVDQMFTWDDVHISIKDSIFSCIP